MRSLLVDKTANTTTDRTAFPWRTLIALGVALCIAAVGLCLAGCSQPAKKAETPKATATFDEDVDDKAGDEAADAEAAVDSDAAAADAAAADPTQSGANAAAPSANADALRAALNITEDYRASFDHGPKPAQYQKYIVLHDTEGDSNASSVIDWWDSNGNLVASQFIINKDGSIYQAVPMDRIAHHAGYGDAGHNDYYGITEDGRDDMLGSTPIGSWAPDYAMNAWSIGIELVHTGGSGGYPEAQLEALDNLIAYIDAYYGTQSRIIDHKDWRSGNSDTSPEFAPYLANYQVTRTHDGVI